MYQESYMLEFHRVYLLKRLLIHVRFWIYQSFESVLETTLKNFKFKYLRETLKNKDMFGVYKTWNLNSFSGFEQYSFRESFRKEFEK